MRSPVVLALSLLLAIACAAALTACRTDAPASHGAPPAPVPTTKEMP